MTAAAQWRWTGLAGVVSVSLLAFFVSIGGDWDWLVALGDHVRRTASVPDDVPFAVADTSGWHNVPVLAEVLASLLHATGARAAVFAHLAAVAVALGVLAVASRARGASDLGTAGALATLVVGSLATLGVVRAQTFSLVPFALLLALLTRQHRRPDRGIWWVVPLVVVWGNLHGAALLGVCVLGAYLLVDRLRLRPAETVAVGVASLVALCVTPQGWLTPRYYLEVFDNVSAQRAEGLWARPTLGDPFDVVLLAAAALLVVALLRTRRPLWEYVAVAGLCAATASASRHGVWLLFLLVVLGTGRAVREREPAPDGTDAADGADGGPAPTRARVPVLVGSVLVLAVAVPVAASRGDSVLGASPEVVAAVVGVAGDDVVLAPAPLSESLAVAGVRLWASNPLDAFRHEDQAAYLDFLDGHGGDGRGGDGRGGARAALSGADVVVVRDGSAPQALVEGDRGFTARPCGEGWTCYVRVVV